MTRTKAAKQKRAAAKRLGLPQNPQAAAMQQAIAQQRASNLARNASKVAAKQVLANQVMGGGGNALPNTGVARMQSRRGLGAPVGMHGVEFAYNALGSTDTGREWALVALHPCGEYVTTANGVPDETQAVAVTPCYRAESKIQWDASLFGTPPTPTAPFQYDVQIVSLPHPELNYIYRLGYQGGWSKWVPVHMPVFQTGASGTASTLDSMGLTSHRGMGKGLTMYLDAPALADQGRLIAGQIKPQVQKEEYDFSLSSTTGASPQSGSGRFEGWGYYVPLSEDELVQQDPKCAQWHARDGCYIPHRFVQPKQDFVATNPGTLGHAPGSSDSTALAQVPLTGLWLMNEPSTTLELSHTMDMITGGTWTAALSGLYDPAIMDWGYSEPENFYTSVTFFLGISNQASVQVKTRLHVEAEALGRNSASAPFSHQSPMLDRQALDLVAKVGQVQQHVFFAADNDLGSILASIGKILPGIVTPVADIVGSSGIPILGDIGKVVGRISRGISGML